MKKDCICGDPRVTQESPHHSFSRLRASSSPFRGKGIHPSSLGSFGGEWRGACHFLWLLKTEASSDYSFQPPCPPPNPLRATRGGSTWPNTSAALLLTSCCKVSSSKPQFSQNLQLKNVYVFREERRSVKGLKSIHNFFYTGILSMRTIPYRGCFPLLEMAGGCQYFLSALHYNYSGKILLFHTPVSNITRSCIWSIGNVSQIVLQYKSVTRSVSSYEFQVD